MSTETRAKRGGGARIAALLVVAACLAFLAPPLGAETVPPFTLQRLDGSSFRLDELIGRKIIVVDFWATWCKPCQKFLTKLEDIAGRYRQSVEVLAISIDDASALSRVESYVRGKRFSFTVLLDPDAAVARMFNPALKVPFTFVIDRGGEIRYTHAGYMPGDENEISDTIERLGN